MHSYDNFRLLIISNNVLSYTKNNGKTILSYFDCVPRSNIFQLYLSSESPSISGVEYFRLSDYDVLRGKLNQKKRGKVVSTCNEEAIKEVPMKQHGDLARLAREFLWVGSWKSKQLYNWLDIIKPTAVFFVGGDCCYAYRIYMDIVSRYNVVSSMYITDDYLMSRTKESFIHFLRRKLIRKEFKDALKVTDNFFTISEQMRLGYKSEFVRDSKCIVNMVEPLKDYSVEVNTDSIKLVYTGSLYYGRDDVLSELSEAIETYNKSHSCELDVFLYVYTNNPLTENMRERIFSSKYSVYGGSLNSEQLKKEINNANILVFVESFDEKQIEKTKYSLSTKVPEYMSVGKPILAIGPSGIGSIEYLKDVSMNIQSQEEIYDKLCILLKDKNMQADLGRRALDKYYLCNDKSKLQSEIVDLILKGNV